MRIKKFEAYTQPELMDDLESEELEKEIKEEEEDFDPKEWEIDTIIDIMDEDPSKSEESNIAEEGDLSESAVTFDMSVPKDISRGDYIWITALIKKKNANYNNTGRQSVIKLRVVELYYGLSHLNKVLNQ